MVIGRKVKMVQLATRSIPFLFLTLLVGCSQWPEPIEITGESENVTIFRMDKALFDTGPNDMTSKCLELQATQGPFFQTYVERIMRLSAVEDPRLAERIVAFTAHPDWKKAQADVESALGDLEDERVLFVNAFSRLKTVYPDSVVPKVVIYNSGFNDAAVFSDSTIGIGAEWFIGTENELIQRLDPTTFPNYMKARLNPEMLVPYAMKGWVVGKFAQDASGEDLLSHMVSMGKAMVLLDLILPEVHDTLKLSFTEAQLEWCEEQEFNIWRELVDKEMLFSKDLDNINRIMNDAPFTNGFPRESPGHIGEWIGKQMVESYWKRNKELTLREVLNTKDPRRILKYYKP